MKEHFFNKEQIQRMIEAAESERKCVHPIEESDAAVNKLLKSERFNLFLRQNFVLTENEKEMNSTDVFKSGLRFRLEETR